MILVDFLPAREDRSWTLARQVGITHAIVKCAPELTGLNPPWDPTTIATIQTRFADAGFTIAGFEGDQMDMRRIKLGLDGRDEDLARYRTMLYNMGQFGIPLLCYNFMATFGWCRTHVAVPTRGGALTNRFQRAALDLAPVPEADRVSEEKLWSNYKYFIHAVLPAAEKADVQMALHPDDPPLSPLRGVGRIFTSPAAFDLAMMLSDSPSHRITFCQANFLAMGCDVSAVARRLAPRIAFVHFRDILGTAENFTETFHDDGPTDMPAMLKLYSEIGFRGPIRVDHVPSLAGEEDLPHGYAYLGRLFAVGYMKGIMDTAGIDYI